MAGSGLGGGHEACLQFCDQIDHLREIGSGLGPISATGGGAE